MMSKILTELIDKAIVPAVLLLASRVVSIILVSKYLGLNFEITKAGFIFESASDYIKVNSYSTLIMVALLMIGISYILIKSLFFHDSHIKPAVTSKLFSLNAQSLIQGSFELYTQGIVWLSYSYLLLLVSGIMALSNLMYDWVFYITFGSTLLATVLFVSDVEDEIKIKKENKEDYDADKSFLENLQKDGGLE